MANPHSPVWNPASSSRNWKMPTATSLGFSVTAKQAYVPKSRIRSVHAMNRSNPSTVAGGGEMNLDTSSVVSIENSDVASEGRSSRRLSLGNPI